MAASVRIEDEAFSDLRFRHLGNLLGTSEFDALGRMAHLWRACTARSNYFLPREMVRAIVDPALLVAADLAEDGPEMRIKGTETRIEWLGEKRKAAQKGGDATKAKWRGARPPQPKAKRRPNEGPPAPAPAPALKEERVSEAPPRRPPPPEAVRIAERIADHVLSRDARTKWLQPASKAASIAKWADSIRLLHDSDGRDWPEIERVWLWASRSSFWAGNILSGGTLRQQFEKLVQQMASPTNGHNPHNQRPATGAHEDPILNRVRP